MNFEYILTDKNADASEISYDVFINKWDENGIDLQLNFSNPLAVSQGRGNDKAMVSIKNPGLFVSKSSGKMIQAENALAVQNVPRQVTLDVDVDKLEGQAIAASLSVKASMILLVILQLRLGMSLDNMFLLFYFMQLMCYLKVYDSPFPANV